MNDSPGWASPGSAPSDGENSGKPPVSEPPERAHASSKWSQNQPPAAQWSSPGQGPTPTPGPPGRPGPQQGPGGWGPVPGQGRPPGTNWNQNYGGLPAAKPGVIPLRPLGVGEILDGAVSTARAHWRTVLGLTLAVAVVAEVAQLAATRFLLPEPTTIDPHATGTEAVNQALDSMQSSLLSLTPPLIIGQLATLLTTAVLALVASRSVLGRPTTLGDTWAEARPRLLSLCGLLGLLIVMFGAITAVGVLPGVLLGGGGGAALAALGGLAACAVTLWLYIRFIFAGPALMLERQGIGQSLRRSAKLTNGSWWRIFGISMLAWLLSMIVAMIIALPFTAIAMALDSSSFDSILNGSTPDFGWSYLIVSGIGGVIASAVTYPLVGGVTALLYIDQRIRREALDLELARAAGVPGHANPGS
ncbi:glycerophosphoryl diester phosphodiesterase membrane domain-containing protein [Streptomyces sp. NBC_00083]|uniref:glycerophosphoryl diester phosphodiesterase membrane domain-containing protein n=1 Tax=Streptomyces sp. NBC_00083 TaxID=2975647 RepID=UPI002251A582|nr:glycerophosphoryl diester phosphodiesterase membrane domain-containing protein [Streptomyces sp. NBC_00083]MCX5382106.1 glycerophosphoryl diester phosphodiesterase membrane domain-containing protein [Streptomyces sp. NBC_00083]